MASEPLSAYVPQVDQEAGPLRENPRPISSNVNANVMHFTPHEPTQLVQVQEARYVQYGQWKDGICECCTKGGWPSLFMSAIACFWPCLFGKVASRIRWSAGLPRSLGLSNFAQWTLIMSVLIGLSLLSSFAHMHEAGQALSIHIALANRCVGHDNPYAPCEPTPAERKAYREYSSSAEAWEFFSYLLGMVIAVLLLLLRLRTRSKFLIPSSCEGGTGAVEARRLTFLGLCEDAWCACCCGCCTLAQLSRHTYAAEDCAPCADPGPAESMEPNFPGQTHHVTQMHVINQNGMYGDNIPVATSVVPVADHVRVGQGMPVPTPQVYSEGGSVLVVV
eukprot:CAMPEP_0173379096 /NCGR_PEP_ID=MMETSP1356-20130122/2158_1 /TAXON_ID=77927 ORGANISM="Hemiselmis virescens, Strain PCC157" /NCGR_SAMPLE_ID=MMETSP1356 /ASSEMBLY_ACC=CAM_ASM_000847 /LENGTH=333 /DNA_ID=CAMNT_0014332365 /DNA_START=27 /DNA_END=1028 /DNA_ORIENTATION=-